MHPALSVIFFTTASGAGYGLLILSGILAPLGMLPTESWFAFVVLAIAITLVTAGLLSSTFHLGHPERAWRAVSQWRTSWLSREGVAALATYLPAGLFAIGWIFLGETGGIWAVFGFLTAAGAALTVYCTAMIYASLETVPRWGRPTVVPTYFALALMTGVLLLDLVTLAFGAFHWLLGAITLVAIIAAWALKAAYWRGFQDESPAATAASATGLGGFGRVRLFEAPHTSENYLMKEMGYQVARRHAGRLRGLVHLCAFAVPTVAAIVLVLEPGPLIGLPVAIVAVLAAAVGVFAERWLFFAEAKHVVTLYYGAETV